MYIYIYIDTQEKINKKEERMKTKFQKREKYDCID